MISVVKIGGSVIGSGDALRAFCKDFAALPSPKLLVHGGGSEAARLQEALGQTPVKIEGRRVTDEDTLKAVTMMYAGWCNKTVVSLLQADGCNAIGLAGCDANVIRADRRPPKLLSDGVTKVDYGYVGDVTAASVNREALLGMLAAGLTPALCAINHDGRGQLLNTNADTIASSLAAALGARLICCFECSGVLADRHDPSSVIPVITPGTFSALKANGTVDSGMIPKIDGALEALRSGAASVTIKHYRDLLRPGGTEISLDGLVH